MVVRAFLMEYRDEHYTAEEMRLHLEKKLELEE